MGPNIGFGGVDISLDTEFFERFCVVINRNSPQHTSFHVFLNNNSPFVFVFARSTFLQQMMRVHIQIPEYKVGENNDMKRRHVSRCRRIVNKI